MENNNVSSFRKRSGLVQNLPFMKELVEISLKNYVFFSTGEWVKRIATLMKTLEWVHICNLMDLIAPYN